MPDHTDLWNIVTNPAVQACVHEIGRIAGYQLNGNQQAPFLRFHAFVTSDPPPAYITTWRSNPHLERWYHRHVNGVLGDVQNTIACVSYHRDNLSAMENTIHEIFTRSDARTALGNSNLG